MLVCLDALFMFSGVLVMSLNVLSVSSSLLLLLLITCCMSFCVSPDLFAFILILVLVLFLILVPVLVLVLVLIPVRVLALKHKDPFDVLSNVFLVPHAVCSSVFYVF